VEPQDGEDGIYLFPIPARALTYSTKKKESRTVLWLMTVGIGKRWRRRLEGTSGQNNRKRNEERPLSTFHLSPPLFLGLAT